LSIFGQSTETIDDMMKNLYEDPDILEYRCLKCGEAPLQQNSNNISKDDLGSTTWRKPSKSLESVTSSLYEGYFTAGFDPTLLQLQQVTNWTETDRTSKFMAMIEETDTDKDVILSNLANMIEKNYPEIMKCMNDVYDIDADIARACTQITISRRNIGNANEIMTKGSVKVTTLQKKKQRRLNLLDMLKNFKVLKDLYNSTMESIVSGELNTATECAYHVLSTLNRSLYDSFDLAQSIRSELVKTLPLIRSRADKELNLLSCRQFVPSKYSKLIHAYLLLDYMRDRYI
jgi:hypothetical protein